MSGQARVPESLLDPGLAPLWAAARDHLDRYGADHRGTVQRPELGPGPALALESLLGRVPRRIPLGALESALVDRSVGSDLDDALRRLGFPPSAAAAERRVVRARRDGARRALIATVATWPEPWAAEWAEQIRRAGLIGDLDAAEVVGLVDDVRRLLDRRPGPTSRTELAAQLYGSAHALDPGTRRSTLASSALRRLVGPLDGRDLWEAAGVATDEVSAPALTWQLPASGASPLGQLVRAANDGHVPLHLSLHALRRFPLEPAPGTTVYVVENPRIVEAAAERDLPACLVAANGNPSTAVTTLLGRLRDGGARLRYHGDFDAAGIAMCARMHQAGVAPWRMGGVDYDDALRHAEASGTRLDRDPRACVDTPWDPSLADRFGSDRRVVHEELIVDELLAAAVTTDAEF